ncbi:transcriptional regulator, AbrB family [Veillonella sp. oral taxon 780 str. F0422]|nr:transcriptional regulator, AbrB family [Veillonella sp. oral taxon 780 str. F0422]
MKGSMKDIFMATVKVMAKGQVTIPKRIRELLNLENGDYVTFVVNKDRVEILNSEVFIEENIGK